MRYSVWKIIHSKKSWLSFKKWRKENKWVTKISLKISKTCIFLNRHNENEILMGKNFHAYLWRATLLFFIDKIPMVVSWSFSNINVLKTHNWWKNQRTRRLDLIKSLIDLSLGKWKLNKNVLIYLSNFDYQ